VNDGNLTVNTGATLSAGILSGNGVFVNNGSLTGDLNLSPNAILMGSGSLSGTLTVANQSILAPGNSVGSISGTDAVWGGAGVFQFEFNDAEGVAGGPAGWDVLNLSGTLEITATALNPFQLHISTLGLDQNAGEAVNFDPTQSYSWMIASAAGGITGLSADAFSIDTLGVLNDLNGGSFGVSQLGNNLYVDFIVIPEVSSLALSLILLGVCFGLRRKALKTV
jgi:hypothetical protein